MKKIKKSYFIIIFFLLIIIFGVKNYKGSQEKEKYIIFIKSYLTNLRQENYFNIQNTLDKNISNQISIEDIKIYCKNIKITQEPEIKLEDIKKDNNIIALKGVIDKDLPFQFTLLENNSSYIILSQTINSKTLKPKEYSFPIIK